METFSLLKYWKGTANMRTTTDYSSANMRTATAKTIATTILRSSSGTDSSDDEDESSFFDLEFSGKNNELQNKCSNDNKNIDSSSQTSNEEEEQVEEVLNFTDTSIVSPSDDLFFNPSSIVITASDSDSKPFQSFPVSIFKTATKFRVFMLGNKKPKALQTDVGTQTPSKKLFIKFKVEEVPLVSLFNSKKSTKTRKTKEEEESEEEAEKVRFSKESLQKYINKIKPLYVRVSKRYADVSSGAEVAKEAARVVRKRLGKSKSAIVASVASPQRRDDSLLQQEDGIQSAIAHCKKSFNNNASKGSRSPLVRSKSDPTDDRSA